MNEPPADAASPSSRGWWGNTFSALRHRAYRYYFVGQLVSLIGSWVQLTAQAWLAWELTGQSRWPALVSAAQVLPTFVLGFWGGSLADRWPKRPLIFATQSAFLLLSLLLALLTYLGEMTGERLVAIAAIVGLVTAVDLPARLAFVTEMVGRDDLINAVALNSLVFNAARAIGPAISAQLLVYLGPAECFLVNSLSYVAVLAALGRMKPQYAELPTRQQSSETWGTTLRFLLGRRDLVLLLAMTTAVAACCWPVLALLPAVAQQQFGMGSGQYGALVSALGAGALIGAMIVAAWGARVRRQVFLSCGVVLAVTGLTGLAMAHTYVVALVCCIVLGSGMIVFLSNAQATLQLSAAGHNRGRVMGVWSMVLCGAQPLGNLLAGNAADRWGVTVTLAGQAAILVGATAVIALLWWAIRRPLGNDDVRAGRVSDG